MHSSFFISYLRPYKRQFAFIFVLMLLESTISLAIPYFIGQFSRAVLQEPAINVDAQHGMAQLNLHYYYIIAIWVGLILMQAVIRYQSSFKVNMVGARILTNLSCRLYDHVQMLPMDYFSKRKKGEILSLISNDANVIAFFMSGILTGVVPNVIIALGAIILMANINLPLASIITISVPLFFILLKVMGRKIQPLSEQITKQQAGIVAIAAENFSTIKLLKSFTREETESSKFKQSAQEMLDLRRSQFKIQALISPVVQMLISIGIVLVVLVSALNYRAGDLTISQLITLLMYGLLFAKPMSSLASTYGQFQQAMGASTRIIEVFEKSPEANDTGKDDLVYQQGSVQINNVKFNYTPNKPLFTNLNAEFSANSVNVIVGANGSGKTSLLHLLMRFTQIEAGTILIDKQNIATCTLRSLRRAVGLVSQDVALSHGSVLSNITYGQPNTSFEEALEAAKTAGAHDFIEQLPQGYNTQVGDNGVLLSGGQRQRISLARTLLLNCKIIIFDEPTSFADSFGKQAFGELLKTQLSEHTLIVVTHDDALSSIADTLFHLQGGELRISKQTQA